ncbi:MAG: Major facilitator superfamily permease [Bacteroidetes bacterium]|nr:Major facilitator superfamily permease [Bacteroidota bacterium]
MIEKKKIFGFTPNVFYTGIVSFLTDTSVKMVYSVMPLFLMSIGASKTSLSLIEGIAESTASLIKAFSGYWSDRIGRNKPFMLIGYGLSALIMPVYALVVSPLQVLIFRFIERVGKGIRTAPRDSLVAGSVNGNEVGRSFGLHKAMDNSGAILGPLLAFLLLLFHPGDFRLIFLLAGIPGILGMFVLVFGIREAKKRKESLMKNFRFSDFPKRFYLFLAIIFIFTLGNSTDALLMVKANEVGIKITFIPLVYLISSVVSVFLAIPFGSLSDRIGREKLLIAGFLIYSLVYFGFGVTANVYVIVALFALYGIYSALTDGVQKAMISDLTDENKKGTGMGIYNAMLGITLLPASLIAGLLYDKVNSSIPFYFGGVMSLLALLLMLIYITTKPKKETIN